MTGGLQGKRALVTGGSRGIGLAIVGALAEAGAEVTFTARTEAGILAARSALPERASTRGIVCDVTDAEGMAALLAEPVDILVNNAGVIGPIGQIGEVDLERWSQGIRINLLSAVQAIKLALPGLVARRGAVVNLSSGAAHTPMEGWSAYCAGKAALAMVTRCLHMEYGAEGLRAFSFAPGLVDTDMQATIRQSGINPVSTIPRESLRPASEPGQAVAWLCTEAAADLAGGEIDIRAADFRSRAGLEPLP